jgi:hypothetical protein
MTYGTTKDGIEWHWTLDNGDLGELWLTVEDDELGRSFDRLLDRLGIPHKIACQPKMNGDAPLGAQGPPSLQRFGDFPAARREFDGPSSVLLFLTLFNFAAPPRPLQEALASLDAIDDTARRR